MDYEEPKFFHVANYAAQADRDVVDMVSGSPDWEPPEPLREGLRRYADADPPEFQYSPAEGIPALREEIAARRNVPRESVVVTNGATEANYLVTTAALAADDGDEVLLADPGYPYYPTTAKLEGGDVTFVPTEPDGSLAVERFREAASEETALVLLNSPNNPTGAVYPRETLAEMAAIAERVDATLAVDEVYATLDLSGTFESATTLESDRVAVTNAISKSMAATGVRIGYAVLPEHLRDGAKLRHLLINVAASRPAQRAVAHAFRETPPDYYQRTRDRLRDRFETMFEAFDAVGAAYDRPDGAFYVRARFDDFPGTMRNVKRLIDEGGVAGMPGETFGSTGTELIRFSLTTDRVETAADRLVDYFG
ncbi:MAG: pyridoxal phosphate-dependent aminotransferase [Halobaculum sp.]